MKDTRYKNEEWLRRKYHKEGLSQHEIADICGISQRQVWYYMDKYGIEARTANQDKPVPFLTDANGYERWSHNQKSGSANVYTHRLAAVAWFGLDAVRDMEVHHRNNIKWDTREDNVELMTKAEHGALHSKQRWDREKA